MPKAAHLPLKNFTAPLEILLEDVTVKSVTWFILPLGPKPQRVRIARHGKPRANDRSSTIVISYGKPNFRERKFLAQCKKNKVKPDQWITTTYKTKKK